MAYKFQLGDARLSGSLIQEGSIQTSGDITPLNADGARLGSASKEWADLYLADEGIIYWGADNEVMLQHEHNDGVTLISSVASKPVLRVKNTNDDANGAKIRIVKDTSNSASNNDVLGIIDFTGEDAGHAGHIYASMTAKSRVVTAGSEEGAIVFAVTDGGNDETNLLDINNTLDGGVSIANDLQVGDDIFMKSDSAAIRFGADSEVVLEHEHDDGLTLISSVASKPVLRVKNTNNDANGAKIRIVKDTSNSAANGDTLGIIDFTGEDAGHAGHIYASMIVKSRIVTAGSEEGAFVFAVTDGGSDETNLLDINNTLDGGVNVTNGLNVNGHNGSNEGLRLGGTLITSTAAELNLIDGGTAVGSSIALADGDGIIVDDGGTMKKIPASDFKTYLADNSMNVAIKDNGQTLANGINYFADLGGAESVNLPASPDVGDSVYVKAPSNCNSTRTLTISKQGSHTIDGLTSIVLESPHAAVMIVYVTANTWKVF